MHLLPQESRAPYPITTSMRATVRAWLVACQAGSRDCWVISPHTPLWKNPQLSHFYTYPDPIIGTKFGIHKSGGYYMEWNTPAI